MPRMSFGHVLFLNTNNPNASNVFLDTFYSWTRITRMPRMSFGHVLFLNTKANAPNVFWTRFILEHEYPECPECFFRHVVFLNTNTPNAPNVFWTRFILEHEWHECPECFLDTFYSWTRMKRMGYEHWTSGLSRTRIIRNFSWINHKLNKESRVKNKE